MNDNKNETALYQPDSSIGEIVLYQPDNSIQLEVRIEDETVWLNRQQMSMLFGRDVKTIGKHINNALKEELQALSVVAKFATTATDGKAYLVEHYSLDMILSVGYRVKSQQGIHFRIWSNRVLKDYILKGYAVNRRFERLEHRVTETEKKIDFFVKTALPPREGVFYDGQIFDAHVFVSGLIKSAKKTLVLIDNYMDESVLLLLSKRTDKVKATVYTAHISSRLRLDLKKHNAQYPPINVQAMNRSHDRFLFVDDDVYHIGASLKDLGKKLFAFSKMEFKADKLLQDILPV
ncbi:MAG: virulence RhuM family protein [Bacteroidales bacterium]|nr:virulence RhuM family protein [Bacteroidales bacterium]